MDEEIKKLKSLLDEGAITKEEFEHLQEQVLGAQNELPDNPESANNDEQKIGQGTVGDAHEEELEEKFKESLIIGLNLLHGKIGQAGDNISSSVSYTVLSQIFLVIAMLIFFFGFLPVVMSIGFDFSSIDESFVLFASMSLFFFASFICWVTQLIKLNKAGTLMKKLRSHNY